MFSRLMIFCVFFTHFIYGQDKELTYFDCDYYSYYSNAAKGLDLIDKEDSLGLYQYIIEHDYLQFWFTFRYEATDTAMVMRKSMEMLKNYRGETDTATIHEILKLYKVNPKLSFNGYSLFEIYELLNKDAIVVGEIVDYRSEVKLNPPAGKPYSYPAKYIVKVTKVINSTTSITEGDYMCFAWSFNVPTFKDEVVINGDTTVYYTYATVPGTAKYEIGDSCLFYFVSTNFPTGVKRVNDYTDQSCRNVFSAPIMNKYLVSENYEKIEELDLLFKTVIKKKLWREY